MECSDRVDWLPATLGGASADAQSTLYPSVTQLTFDNHQIHHKGALEVVLRAVDAGDALVRHWPASEEVAAMSEQEAHERLNEFYSQPRE